MSIDEKFFAAVRAMENRTRRVAAFVVIDPAAPADHGTVRISYPADGAGRLHVVAWLPGSVRHHGSAGGGGYDKASAAMSGAKYQPIGGGELVALKYDKAG